MRLIKWFSIVSVVASIFYTSACSNGDESSESLSVSAQKKTPQHAPIPPWLDMDGNGTFDEFDKALLNLYRDHGSNFGDFDSWVIKYPGFYKSESSKRSTRHIVAYGNMLTAQLILDIDRNGKVQDTDYNLLILYFALRSQPNTMNSFIVSDPELFLGEGAKRKTGKEVKEYMDSLTLPRQQIKPTSIRPECSAVGSRSEGWYSNGRLLKHASCSGQVATCQQGGSRTYTQHGYYVQENGRPVLLLATACAVSQK